MNDSGTAVSEDKAFYVTADGTVLKEKPIVKPPDGTSTVVVPAVPPVTAPSTGTGTGTDGGAAGVLLPAAPPVLGDAVTLRPLRGTVRVRPRGARHFVPLAAGANVAVGSLVDTRHGRVALKSARDAHGSTQKGTFWGGVFQIRQRRRSGGVTDLMLRGGGFEACRARGSLASASSLARESSRRRRAIRWLWGKDRHSRFRTHGRDSVATVRGTRWVTTDRCDGTLTRVTQGKVLVRDLHRHRNRLLRAGHAYLARHHARR